MTDVLNSFDSFGNSFGTKKKSKRKEKFEDDDEVNKRAIDSSSLINQSPNAILTLLTHNLPLYLHCDNSSRYN